VFAQIDLAFSPIFVVGLAVILCRQFARQT
jgi:hypothetical protein